MLKFRPRKTLEKKRCVILDISLDSLKNWCRYLILWNRWDSLFFRCEIIDFWCEKNKKKLGATSEKLGAIHYNQPETNDCPLFILRLFRSLLHLQFVTNNCSLALLSLIHRLRPIELWRQLLQSATLQNSILGTIRFELTSAAECRKFCSRVLYRPAIQFISYQFSVEQHQLKSDREGRSRCELFHVQQFKWAC